MLNTTLTHNETYIKITRVGHHYYLDERQQGFVIAMNSHVHRDIAIDKVQSATGGALPAECNFDVCHQHSWVWRKDDHLQEVQQ